MNKEEILSRSDYYDNQAVPYGVAGGYHCAFILYIGIRLCL